MVKNLGIGFLGLGWLATLAACYVHYGRCKVSMDVLQLQTRVLSDQVARQVDYSVPLYAELGELKAYIRQIEPDSPFLAHRPTFQKPGDVLKEPDDAAGFGAN